MASSYTSPRKTASRTTLTPTLSQGRGQLDELTRVTRYRKIRERPTPALAGKLINELRDRRGSEGPSASRGLH